MWKAVRRAPIFLFGRAQNTALKERYCVLRAEHVTSSSVSALPKNTAYIYLILDADGTPCYVGKSDHPDRRFRQHRMTQRHRWATSYLIIEAVALNESWKDREEFWISYYRRWYPLKNVSKGGRGAGSHGVFYRNREEITALLKNTNQSFTSIGRKFGVSRELIRQIALSLGIISGNARRTAKRTAVMEAAAAAIARRPRTTRFIARCEANGLHWEFIPRGHGIAADELLVGSATVRLAASFSARNGISPTREYLGVRPLKGVWDVIAYEIPDGRWFILDRSNQVRKSTSFSLDPIPNRGSKQSKHHWRQFVEAWHLFKPPRNSAHEEQDCALPN